MKKTIKINFVDVWFGFDYKDLYFYQILKERYNVIISKDPDYLFFSCMGREFLKYNCIKIFFTCENNRPDFNLCDYAIGFDYITFEDRYLRCPIYLIEENRKKILRELPKRKMIKHSKFCNMVVSNRNAPERLKFYQMLSEYKKVDSGGKTLNNLGYLVPDKLKFQRDYKFSMAFENSSTNGYCTEKLVDAFASYGIPIYYGDPKVELIFNPKTFINIKSEKDFAETVELIKKIDNDDKLYASYFKEPCLLNPNYIKDEEQKIKDFIYNIFDQDLADAKRLSNSERTQVYNKKMRMVTKLTNIFYKQ